MKKGIIILVLVAAAIAAAVVLRQAAPSTNTDTNASTDSTSGLRVGKNAIYVAEQPPGTTLNVSLVAMEKAGFVVVHEADASGAVGAAIGVSGYLQAGEREDVKISLSRPAKVGEQLIAMIHEDNGNKAYDDEAADAAIIENGAPVWMVFSVEAGAEGGGEIQL